MRKALFSIDTYGGPPIPGWTQGEDWNGWAMPLFEAREAWEIVFRQNTVVVNSAWYYSERDEFCFRLNEGEPARYCGVDVEVVGCVLRLYAIGSGSWTWEEVGDREQE